MVFIIITERMASNNVLKPFLFYGIMKCRQINNILIRLIYLYLVSGSARVLKVHVGLKATLFPS